MTSAKPALTPEELAFCRIYRGFGDKNYTEAYRRAFYSDKSRWTDDPDEANENPRKHPRLIPSPKLVNKKAAELLKQEHIQAYLTELSRGTSTEHAEAVLHEQVVYGEDATARRRAAELILDREDQLGRRDASMYWAEIMCAIGAEVVVPAPSGGETVFALRELYPRYTESLPPDWVLDKTIQTLERYKKTQREREENQDADVRV